MIVEETAEEVLAPPGSEGGKATLESVMEGLLSGYQIDALLSRRDCIVRYYEGKIASLGEGAVLYERPRPDKWSDER